MEALREEAKQKRIQQNELQKKKLEDDKRQKLDKEYKKQTSKLNVNGMGLGQDRYYNLYWATPLMKDILFVAIHRDQNGKMIVNIKPSLEIQEDVPLEQYERMNDHPRMNA